MRIITEAFASSDYMNVWYVQHEHAQIPPACRHLWRMQTLNSQTNEESSYKQADYTQTHCPSYPPETDGWLPWLLWSQA